jgi:hypothetical protein
MFRRPSSRAGRPGGLLLVLGALALAVAPRAAHAQGGDPGERTPTKVAVVTFGPGDHPFLKFGHNALLLEYAGREGASVEGIVFNWGTFSFEAPGKLIPKFLRGRMKYWLSLSPSKDTLAHYMEENRTVEIQELDLTDAQKQALARALFVNARRENREYLYDYFWDNCSTRVRDAVDVAVGGLLKQAAAVPAAQTQRSHALRMTADLFPEYLGLAFGLGSRTDAPSTMWEEAFLPERLRDLLAKVAVPAEGGGRKPLVKSHVVSFRAARPDKPGHPPAWGIWFGVVGVVLGGGFAGLGVLARRHLAARIAVGAGVSLLGLVLGLLGIILLLLWALTDHKVAHANENILQVAPWVIALVVYGIGVARGRPAATRKAFLIVAAAAGASLLGLLLKALPWFVQDNSAFIALFLPFWGGLAFALRGLERRAR